MSARVHRVHWAARNLLHVAGTLILFSLLLMVAVDAIGGSLSLSPSDSSTWASSTSLMVLMTALLLLVVWWFTRGHPFSLRYFLMGAIFWATLAVGLGFGAGWNATVIRAVYIAGLLAAVGVWYWYEREFWNWNGTSDISHVRGSRVLDARNLRLFPPPTGRAAAGPGTGQVQAQKDPDRPLIIGGVRIPRQVETRHIMVVGTTGSGKSVTIADLLEVIRARGERAIVYDRTGDHLSVFLRRGDTVLNPLDRRTSHWTPWADATTSYDYERIAAALIPENRDNPFWHESSRAVLSSILAESHTMQEALRLMQTAGEAEINTILERQGKAGVFGSRVTAQNVRASMVAPTTSLRYLKDPPEGTTAFSIREWVGNDRSSWLWLTSRSDMDEALRPLLTVWVDQVVTAVTSQPPSQSRRIWLILDEVARLQFVPSLEAALTLGRKHGLVVVLGLQTVAQLRDVYGRDKATTLLGQPQTRLLLKQSDPESAEWASKTIGERHVIRGIYGESSHSRTGGGTNYTFQHFTENAVLGSEFSALPSLEGFIGVADDPAWKLIQLAYVKRHPVVVPYAPLSSDTWTLPTPSNHPPTESSPGSGHKPDEDVRPTPRGSHSQFPEVDEGVPPTTQPESEHQVPEF